MKYFVVSDIHSNYKKLKKALDDANFNEETDTLVVAGDSFDRGDETLKVLDYLVNLPHKILIWGNHEYMLYDFVNQLSDWTPNAIYNGTDKTVEAISGIYNCQDIDDIVDRIQKKETNAAKQLYEYFDLLCHAVEFDNYYVTHGWLPFEGSYKWPMKLIKDWKDMRAREYSKKEIDDRWYIASWVKTPMAIRQARFNNADLFPDKTLIVGHYHADTVAADGYGDYREDEYKDVPIITIDDVNWNGDPIKREVKEVSDIMYKSKDGKLIALDGCTAYITGVVNVFVIEQDNQPIIY